MLGFGKHKSVQIEYMRHNAKSLVDAFYEHIEDVLDYEEALTDDELRQEGSFDLVEQLLAGSVMLAKVYALEEKPFRSLLKSLSKAKKNEVADALVLDGDKFGDPEFLNTLTFYIVAIVLYQSAGENLMEASQFEFILTVIENSERLR